MKSIILLTLLVIHVEMNRVFSNSDKKQLLDDEMTYSPTTIPPIESYYHAKASSILEAQEENLRLQKGKDYNNYEKAYYDYVGSNSPNEIIKKDKFIFNYMKHKYDSPPKANEYYRNDGSYNYNGIATHRNVDLHNIARNSSPHYIVC